MKVRRKRGARGDGNGARENGSGPEKIDIQVDQMLRAANTGRASRLLAIKLGQHCVQIAALTKIVGMASMPAQYIVMSFKRR